MMPSVAHAKVCCKCRLAKPFFSGFAKDASRAVGKRPDCRACSSRHIRAYYASVEGREKIKARRQQPEVRQRAREWFRDYHRRPETKRRRKERRYQKREMIIADQNGVCNGRLINPDCEIDINQSNTHIDHILPVSRGGRSNRDNLQALCAGCNLSKNKNTMEEWAVKMSRAVLAADRL